MSAAPRVLVIAGLLALAPFVVGAQVWERYLDGYHGPYRGRVIDAETKQPLAGAVVVAQWDRVRVFLLHSSTVFYDAREVLTDRDGQFVLHAKDVEEAAPYQTLRPTFVIFFPGYGYFPRYQVTPQGFIGGIFEGAGVTVELPRLKTREERLNVIRGLPPVRVPDRKMPNLLHLLNVEETALGLEPRLPRKED